MAETKYNQARLIPFVLMSLVTLVLLFWAMRQCDSGEDSYAMVAEEKARQTYLDSIRRVENQAANQAEIEARAEALMRARTQPAPGDSTVLTPQFQTVIKKVTTLYSTINGLNVRSGPSLKNGVLARLPLYAEVEFTGE
ncbi:MAG: SH3 domain-containing protein, partial [Bacteroidota bacterium]